MYSVSLLAYFRCNRGATSIEYALIASLIAVVIIGSITGSGTALQSSLENTLQEIASAFGL